MSAYRYIVQGQVQGVGYRYWVRREAEALGVAGFARNLPDGGVEVVGEAAEEVLQTFEGRLREGPAFAHVSGVARETVSPRSDRGFHIR